MSKDRYYSEKNYKGDYSAFGTALVFALIAGFSLIIKYAVPSIDFWGLSTWGYWLFIPAFFIFIGAIGHIYTDKRMRENVLSAVTGRTDTVNVENLANETGIKPKDLLRVLVDLRVKHGIRYRYDATTGAIIFGEAVQYEQAPEFVEPLPKKQAEVIFPTGEMNFCPYCGYKAPTGSKFCESCGSRLE